MAEITTNYGLVKPAENDFYNIENFNNNFNIIDEAMKGIDDTAVNALSKADAAKADEYGVLLDDSTTAGVGYWFKMLDAHISNQTSPHFSVLLAVQDMYGGSSRYPTGLLELKFSANSGSLDSTNTKLKWITADKEVSNYLNNYAINVDTSDKSNIVVSLYIYNSAQYRSIRVTNVSAGSRVYSSENLEVTFYSYDGHSGVSTALPSSGSKIYSTAGEYMLLLSSSVNNDSETTGANSKAVKTAFDKAEEAVTIASEAVKKTGDTMTGKLRVDNVEIGDCSAAGANALAQGIYVEANGDYSVAFGRQSKADALGAYAGGDNTTASGMLSMATGERCYALGYASCATGQWNTANLINEVVIGRGNALSSGSDTTWSGTGNVFVIGNGDGLTGIRSNSFRVTNDGKVFGLSSFNSSGADYAEYFEWLDGNVNDEDRIGHFVSLEDGKIRIANSSNKNILGAVSAAPGVIGNSYDDSWQGMYLTDEWGRLIYEDVSVPAVTETIHHEAVTDENGDTVTDEWDEELEISSAGTEYRLAINPDYNSDEKYVPRSKRKEWCAVGLLGRLKVYSDGTCTLGGFCSSNEQGIATDSDSGYLVIGIEGEIVEILFR